MCSSPTQSNDADTLPRDSVPVRAAVRTFVRRRRTAAAPWAAISAPGGIRMHEPLGSRPPISVNEFGQVLVTIFLRVRSAIAHPLHRLGISSALDRDL